MTDKPKLLKIAPRLLTVGNRLPTMQAGSWRTDKQSAAQRGYGHKWRSARTDYLRAHPLCVYCQRVGRTTAADVVDHITPHRGDMSLFWSRSNWQSLCSNCHNTVKAGEERADGLR